MSTVKIVVVVVVVNRPLLGFIIAKIISRR